MCPGKRTVARLIEKGIPGRLIRAAPLRWNVSPENMPYAIHAGVQPELVAGAEIIVGRRVGHVGSLEPGAIVHAAPADGEWTIEPISSIQIE